MLLRFEDHGDVGLKPSSDFGFAREAVAVPRCVLPDAAVLDWHTKGWLGLISLHLASLQCLHGLLDLNAQRANERRALA